MIRRTGVSCVWVIFVYNAGLEANTRSFTVSTSVSGDNVCLWTPRDSFHSSSYCRTSCKVHRTNFNRLTALSSRLTRDTRNIKSFTLWTLDTDAPFAYTIDALLRKSRAETGNEQLREMNFWQFQWHLCELRYKVDLCFVPAYRRSSQKTHQQHISIVELIKYSLGWRASGVYGG